MLKISFFFILFTTQTWAKGSVMINEVIQSYFQGYQQADVALIKKSFHPDTRLLSVDHGKLDVTEVNTWLKNLEDRRMRGDIRKGILSILSIDQTHETATAKNKIRFESFEFTDYLSLLKIGGKWIIVGNIYHYQEI